MSVMEKGGLKELKKKIKEKQGKITTIDLSKGLSTGSTLLNLSLTGNSMVGWLPGFYYLFVGDSNSGKSYITLGALAEASINPNFDDYDLIYNGPEEGALMDIRKHYGVKLERRLTRIVTRTIEEFYYDLDDRLSSGKPFIEILDSWDVLDSESAQEKFDEQKKAFREGRETAGSYGDGKPKKNSSLLRTVVSRLAKSQSILIGISQTRDNIPKPGIPMFMQPKKTRSGGHAMKFYAMAELWSSVKETLKKKIRGRDLEVGKLCRIEVKRTRVTGLDRTVEIPIYPSMGVDDVGSCVDFMIDWKSWKTTGAYIEAEDLELKGTRDEIIRAIEEGNKERELQLAVLETWHDIEQQCSLQRKRRYSDE